MTRRSRSNVHTHICMKCSTRAKPTVWEHEAPECFVPHPTAKDCPKCATGGGGDHDSPQDWWHGHYCPKHNHEWDHVDKKCLLKKTDTNGMPEVWTLDCPNTGKTGVSASQSGSTGTAQVSRNKNKMATCPQCGTRGAKQIADETGLTGRDEFVCMECGTEFVL